MSVRDDRRQNNTRSGFANSFAQRFPAHAASPRERQPSILEGMKTGGFRSDNRNSENSQQRVKK